jgi:competence protein ComEA
VGEEQQQAVPASPHAWLQEWRSDRRVIAALCACIAVAGGVAWWRASASAAPAPVHIDHAPALDTTVGSTQPSPSLVVDVVGAVRRPGIVRVRAGARIVDVIGAAGGPRPNADLVRLNLAAPVSDGARVAVPAVGAAAPPLDPSAVTGAPPAEGTAGSAGTKPGPVDINTATAAELDALPGIGPATAAAIVRDRETHGPFRSVDDLARVRGIGPAKLAQLQGLVTT